MSDTTGAVEQWSWHKGNFTGGVIKKDGKVRFGLVEADTPAGPEIVAALNAHDAEDARLRKALRQAKEALGLIADRCGEYGCLQGLPDHRTDVEPCVIHRIAIPALTAIDEALGEEAAR